MDTFDNIVLSYDLQLNKFKDELAFDGTLSSKELKYKSVTEREYNRSDFGYCDEDVILARNHFFMQIRKLMELPEIDEVRNELLETACADLYNYVFAQKIANYDSAKLTRQEGQRMASLVLAYGGGEQLYAMVKDSHSKMIKAYIHGYSDYISERLFLNYYKVFEKYGDYALFILQEKDTAIKYYELATLDWYYLDHKIELEWEWDISDRKKNAILRRRLEFQLMRQLVRNPRENIAGWQRVAVWDREDAYKDIFCDFICELEKKEHHKIYRCATKFFYNLNELIESEATRKELRVPVFLAHIIRDSSLYSTMLMIVQVKDKIPLSEKIKHDMFECLCANQSRSLASIQKYIRSEGECDESLDVCLRLLNIKEHVQRTAQFLRMKPTEETELAYYTSLQTFSYMLPFKAEKGMEGKLSVMNIAYMNDPNEGRTLQKFLFEGKIPFEGDIRHRKDARYPYVFIKCFTPQIDFLPMWEMYGDHASGCCLVLDWSQIEAQKMEVPLYHVCYLSSDGEQFHVEQQFNSNLTAHKEIEDELHDLEVLCDSLYHQNDAACLEAMHSILNEILYLFKDSSYAYEKEVRICYQYPGVDKDFRHTPGDFGKLYVATDFPVAIKEVILGPKFKNRSEMMPYLQEQIDRLSRICKMRVPKITLSDIEYL